MFNININTKPLAPSKNEHANLFNQYKWRTTKEFIGDNEIVIGDIKEAIWWNRPLTSNVFCKKESDGLYSYNFPFWQGERLAFKTEYNVLLNKNSIPIAVHIKIPDNWTDKQKLLLKKMVYSCMYDTLIDLGVDKKSLGQPKNDFYYQDKKFSCGEQIFEDDVFTQNVIITLQAEPERELFNKLSGKYANAKTITGIQEQVSSITKEIFIETLIKKLENYIQKYFN